MACGFMDGKAGLWKNANKTTSLECRSIRNYYANYETQWDKSCVEKRVQTISFSTNCSIPPHGKKRKLCCRKFLLSLWDYKDIKLECPNILLIKDTLPLEAYKRLNCISWSFTCFLFNFEWISTPWTNCDSLIARNLGPGIETGASLSI